MTKANEICDSLAVEQRRALVQLGKSYAMAPNDLADGIDAYRDVIATRLERIKDLGKPSDPPNTYISELRAYVRRLENAPTSDANSGVVDPGPVQRILEAERPRLLREAQRYGMDACRSLDSKPLPIVERPLGDGAPPE